jgi:hypothetical protein
MASLVRVRSLVEQHITLWLKSERTARRRLTLHPDAPLALYTSPPERSRLSTGLPGVLAGILADGYNHGVIPASASSRGTSN